MFRRIQLINELKNGDTVIHGLCGMSTDETAEAWIEDLAGCKHPLPRNVRFYFTERGWRDVGRRVIIAAQKSGQKYRIISVKENSVNVVWSDDIEAAVQPKKRKTRC